MEPVKVAPIGSSRPSRSFGVGRVCAEDECYTVLSRYNPKSKCSVHQQRETPRLRGRKSAA